MTDLYPMLLTPTLHTKVWGGRRLKSELGKMLPGDAPYGESWELHDTSIIGNGPFASRTLLDLIEEYGAAMIGEGHDPSEGMPLLVKLLDASQWLSVQVHPNDEQARELENDPRGKTEAWIILDAEDDAKLVIGVQPDTDREAMAQAIKDNTLEDLLAYQTVTAGDVLYMRANTVHAIGPGILLYEVQQSSNITYRLYDWGRVGLDGRPRELHIEKGVQVSNVSFLPDITHPDDEQLVAGDYFQTWRYTLESGERELETRGQFHSITCIDGVVTLMDGQMSIDIPRGQTAFVPATIVRYTLVGTGTVFVSHMI